MIGKRTVLRSLYLERMHLVICATRDITNILKYFVTLLLFFSEVKSAPQNSTVANDEDFSNEWSPYFAGNTSSNRGSGKRGGFKGKVCCGITVLWVFLFVYIYKTSVLLESNVHEI